jgi:hypothetical protein
MRTGLRDMRQLTGGQGWGRAENCGQSILADRMARCKDHHAAAAAKNWPSNRGGYARTARNGGPATDFI